LIFQHSAFTAAAAAAPAALRSDVPAALVEQLGLNNNGKAETQPPPAGLDSTG
jgi:hypothetical protein